MYKTSRFNFWARLDDQRYVLFNGISGAMYELDAAERKSALQCLKAPDAVGDRSMPGELRDALIEGGFLVPCEIDEVQALLEENVASCVQHDLLELTIAPTYQCNFRCTYCYVNFEKQRMSQEVEEAIVRYLRSSAPRFRQINVTWFGGEPLLCLDTVLRVSRRIVEIARESSVPLLIFLTTNGFLLTLDKATRLVDAGVHFFHITIDGAACDHDRYRVLANGNPSFAQIMQNISAVLGCLPSAHLTLRMNTDLTNISSAIEVLDAINPEFRSRIQINITPIIRDGERVSPELYQSINMSLRYALQHGYTYYDNLIPTDRTTFCSADKRNNFQIGPDGRMYKCSPSKKPEVHVGLLSNQGEPSFNEKYATWHSAPTIGERCSNCPFLCFCRGGCRLERVRGTTNVTCQDKYQDLENIIINRYIALEQQRERYSE